MAKKKCESTRDVVRRESKTNKDNPKNIPSNEDKLFQMIPKDDDSTFGANRS